MEVSVHSNPSPLTKISYPSENLRDTKALEEQHNDIDKKEEANSASNSAPAVETVTPVPTFRSHTGKYKLVRTIGKGNFAKVKLAIHMATGVEVAVKIINKTAMNWAMRSRLQREVDIMKTVNHPNIIKLLEMIENEDVICLVMEYASGGEIFDYLVANGKMREREARIKFRQLVSAIHYCHSKNIVHRDLKAENILLDSNLNVKVADFGLANTFKSDQKLSTFCGSPPYAAPELFLGVKYYGPGVDIWSLGVILFTLVIGHLPFDAGDLRELRNKVLTVHYSIQKGEASHELECLLRKMLVLDPRDRYSLRAIMNDRWVNLGYKNSPLTPYEEQLSGELDKARLARMLDLGFTESELIHSVVDRAFDHIYATYQLIPQMQETPLEAAPRPSESTSKGESSGSATASVAGPSSAAIGRFTVEPIAQDPSRTRHFSGPRDSTRVLLSPSVGVPAPTNYSATSSLPSALKRALAHVGRSFAGGHSQTSTSEPSPTSPPDSELKSVKPSKQLQKDTGQRTKITPAPVPLLTRTKKLPTHAHTGGSIEPAYESLRSSTRAATSSPKHTKTEAYPTSAVRARVPMPALTAEVAPPPPPQQQAVIVNSSGKTHLPNGPCREASLVEIETSDRTQTLDMPILEQTAARMVADVWQHATDQESIKDILTEVSSEMYPSGGRNTSIACSHDSHAGTDTLQQSTWTQQFLRAIGSFFSPVPSRQTVSELIVQKKVIRLKPREVRFPWNVHLTSSRAAADLLQDIKSALASVEGCCWRIDEQWSFLLHCGWTENATSTVNDNCSLQWEMEVCQLPRLHLRGVRLRRIHGSAIKFQQVAGQVIAALRV